MATFSLSARMIRGGIRFSATRKFTSNMRVSKDAFPSHMNKPGPPPLPTADQKEFEDLVRASQRPVASYKSPSSDLREQDEEAVLHPDARSKPPPEFLGDVNPKTGEQGGPKREPLAWGAEGEWTFGGRATDF